jgi:hypothetical protein
MRFLLKVEMPVEIANEMAREGVLGQTIEAILEDLEPEAAYFVTANGERAGLIFIDLDDASEIPRVMEPWFLAFEANVELIPAMTVEDLSKAGPDIEKAVEKFG